MRPDDVKGALDALAAEQPAPTTDAATVMTRGRRRRTERRLSFLGIAAALVAAIAIVGVIAETRDNGDVVSTVDPANVGPPRASSLFPSAREGWKCANPLQYTDDGGETWQKIPLPDEVPASVHNCTAVPGGNAWLAWSNNDGTEWHLLRIRNLTDMQAFALPSGAATDPNPTLTFVDVDHGWFLTGPPETGDKNLYRTTNGGATWTLSSKGSLRGGVTFANAERGWSLHGPPDLGTTDGGTTWSTVALPAPADVRERDIAHFATAAIGNSVVVWSGIHVRESQYRTYFDVSNDNGKTWAVRSGPPGFEFTRVDNFFSATDGSHWAVVSGKELRITDDAGRTWQTRPDLPLARNRNLFPPLVFPTPDVGWITTDEGVWRTTDSGRTWTNVTNGAKAPAPSTTTTTTTPTTTPAAPSAPAPLPIAFTSERDGWICGDRFLHTTDAFATSGTIDVPPARAETPDYHQGWLCAAAGDNAWLLRGSGDPDQPEIVRVRPGSGGVETFRFARFVQGTVVSMTFADADNGWAVVMRQAPRPRDIRDLYRTRDGGATWSLLLADAPVSGSLDFDTPERGWGTTTVGAGLAMTTDGGRTWRTVDAPTPPPRSGLLIDIGKVQVNGNVVVGFGGVTTGMFFNPFFVVSEDGGNTWSLRDGPIRLPGTLPNAFDAADADHWALGTASHLYVTDNGGQSWHERADFAGLAVIEYVARPDDTSIIVSGSADPNGRSTVVLASSDAGESWSLVTYSAPPLSPNAKEINFPGGIFGCPTHRLTPAAPGDPPPGLVDAAYEYISTQRQWEPVASTVYPVGTTTKGTFGELFEFQLKSCGEATMDNAWVVEASGAEGSGSGRSTPRSEVVLSHSDDGWHVFGFYH